MQHKGYVETDAHSAIVRMPSIVADMHRAHLARIQRFKVASIGEKAKAAAKSSDDAVVKILTEELNRKPRESWFSIVSETITAPGHPLVEDIQRVACRYFVLSRNDMLSPRRDMRASYPRHIAMYLAKTLTLQGLPQIGRRFGGRDHTTILHGVRKIERLIKSDWEVAYDVAHVEAML